MNGEPRVVDKAGNATFQSPAAEDVVVRATGEETDGQYDVVEITIPPGPGVTPLHVHHDNDEAMLVIEGEVTVKLGEEHHVLEAGAYAMAPRGLPHTYRNSSDEPARVLFIYTPGNHWRYLQETGERGPVEDESDIEALLPMLEFVNVDPAVNQQAARMSALVAEFYQALLLVGLTALVLGVTLNWRGEPLGLGLNAILVASIETFFICFEVIPGHRPVAIAAVTVALLVLGVVFCGLGSLR